MKEKNENCKKKKKEYYFQNLKETLVQFYEKKNESLWNKQEIYLIWPLPIPSSLALQ